MEAISINGNQEEQERWTPPIEQGALPFVSECCGAALDTPHWPFDGQFAHRTCKACGRCPEGCDNSFAAEAEVIREVESRRRWGKRR